MSLLSQLKKEVDLCSKAEEDLENLIVLNDLAQAEADEDLSKEIAGSIDEITDDLDRLEEGQWFGEELDVNDAILMIHPGAGGTESQDWANMLLRMYLRWAETRGFKVVLNEVSAEEEAGIKSATVTVNGRYAFGLLAAEKGVHRLVRLSPFDSAKRRHTSFASVDVAPVVDEEISVTIDPKDLKIETYRSSGAGGQHVNVTDSAVRITHLPSGIVVQCQNERSQMQNRETALKILRSRMYERELEEREKEMAALREEKREIAWGSQIRSYVLHPYTMVKDHRTGTEKGNAQSVLDGDIDIFIHSYLSMKATESRS